MACGRLGSVDRRKSLPKLTLYFLPGAHSYREHGQHSATLQLGQDFSVQRLGPVPWELPTHCFQPSQGGGVNRGSDTVGRGSALPCGALTHQILAFEENLSGLLVLSLAWCWDSFHMTTANHKNIFTIIRNLVTPSSSLSPSTSSAPSPPPSSTSLEPPPSSPPPFSSSPHHLHHYHHTTSTY